MAGRLSAHNNGPFPLCHDDFFHSNIVVDEGSFDVTGVIDWEEACTVPWELVVLPGFLETIPASFDLPEKYDRDGQPLDGESRQTWREREENIELVQAAEAGESQSCVHASRSRTNSCRAPKYIKWAGSPTPCLHVARVKGDSGGVPSPARRFAQVGY
jgi:hypothetical protein